MKALGYVCSWIGVWLLAVGIGDWTNPTLVWLSLLTYGSALAVRYFTT